MIVSLEPLQNLIRTNPSDGGGGITTITWTLKRVANLIVGCSETVYLIRNGGLHKIGITSDFDRRMRELAPDHVQARLDLDGDENFTAADIERTLHARFKPLRIPQTEYFRLSNEDILECCQIMKSFSEQREELLEYRTVEIPTTPEEERGVAELNRRADALLNRRADALAEEMDAAVEAGDANWAGDVEDRVEALKADLRAFRESIYAD